MKVGHHAPRAQRPVKPGPPVHLPSRGPGASHLGFGGDEITRRAEIAKRVQAVTEWYANKCPPPKPDFFATMVKP